MAKVFGEYKIMLEFDDEQIPDDDAERNRYACHELPAKLEQVLIDKMPKANCKITVAPVNVNVVQKGRFYG